MNQQQQKVEESIKELQQTLAEMRKNPSEENRRNIEVIEKDIDLLQGIFNKVKGLLTGDAPGEGKNSMEALLLEFREPSVSDQINFMIWLHADCQQRVTTDDRMFRAINKTLHGAKWMIGSVTKELAGYPSNQPSTEVRDLLDALHLIKERLEGPINGVNMVEIQRICEDTIEKVTGPEEVSNG